MNDENYEKALNDLLKKLVTEISTLPKNGLFKIKINSIVGDNSKNEIKIMMDYIAESLGRSDVIIFVEDKGDLN